jgi:hypothetical protein
MHPGLAMAVPTRSGRPSPGKDVGSHPFVNPLWVTGTAGPAIASLSPRPIPPRCYGDL